MDLSYENQLAGEGYKLIGGCDEAGRGPLAGPVVAACVVFDFSNSWALDELVLVRDSKQLSAKQRDKLFSLIKERAVAVEIGVVSHKIIDKINILQASFLAMRRSIEQLSVKPDFVLVDGQFSIPRLAVPQTAVINGDALVFSVAAASIIAKVSRDWLMAEYEKRYPGYGLGQHKGYGTKLHLERLAALGPSPIHRLSFKPLTDWGEK
jgi:ribonuclease HII